jgi:hypothetical protein
MSQAEYPVGYDVEFVEERSRLTTFFRLLLVIPLWIMGFFIAIAAYFCVWIAWFAILFTGRYPEGLYNFVAKSVRFGGRVQSYQALAVDPYPPFDLDEHPEYPVRIPIAPPKESYSRVKTFFRIIIGIPVILINYALGIVAQIAGLIAWFWIVFTGKQNEGLHNAIKLGTAYQVRTSAYFALLTEDWPPFSPEGGSALGPASPTSTLPASTPAATPTEAPARDVTPE